MPGQQGGYQQGQGQGYDQGQGGYQQGAGQGGYDQGQGQQGGYQDRDQGQQGGLKDRLDRDNDGRLGADDLTGQRGQGQQDPTQQGQGQAGDKHGLGGTPIGEMGNLRDKLDRDGDGNVGRGDLPGGR